MMFHVLSVRSSYIDAPIRAIHATFFHGKATRGGAFPSSADARLAYDVDLPLRLHKNAYAIADVIAPDFELVVSQAVAAPLSLISTMRLTQVRFDLLYNYPYEIGDLSCGFQTYDAQMRFIDDQFDDPTLHTHIGIYHHVAAPPLRDIRVRHPDASLVTVQIDDEEEELPVSGSIFSQDPIYSLGGSMIMCDEVFRVIEPFIDHTYFSVVSGEVETRGTMR